MHLLWPRRRFGVYFGDHLGELRALLGAELRKRRPKSVLGELFTRLAGAERCSGLLQLCWHVELQYLNLHLTHRGALWASGAAQAAQFVRIILFWNGPRESRASKVWCVLVSYCR